MSFFHRHPEEMAKQLQNLERRLDRKRKREEFETAVEEPKEQEYQI
jgi:hypothetical protein